MTDGLTDGLTHANIEQTGPKGRRSGREAVTQAPPPAPTLRQAFAQPAAFTLLAFGFASGLPFLLV
ncbi:MAG: hypothetical protein ACKOBM_14740, partial [Gammaproteobacteria bacterium]